MIRIQHQFLFLIALCIFSLALSNNTPTSLCEDLIHSSLSSSSISTSDEDKTLLFSFQSNLQSLLSQSSQSPQSSSTCINLLLTKGYYTTLDYYIEQLSLNRIPFKDNLNKAISSLEQKLDQLHNKHRFESNEYQKVVPVFQWAQSLEDIYIEVKFAHRFDSPGCLDISNLTIEVNGSIVSLAADCVLGDVPIRFDLNLDLFGEVIKDASVFNHNSVGRYQMTLRKGQFDYWKRLLRNEEDVISGGGMKVWMEMKEKFEEKLKTYEEKNDEEEFNREYERLTQAAKDERRKKRKEKRKTKGKGKGKSNNVKEQSANETIVQDKHNQSEAKDKDTDKDKVNTDL